MVKLSSRASNFQVGDIVIKASETKQVYFEITDITKDYIKIKALKLPLTTYVIPEEIIKVK